jgi:hypothetical protein
LLQTSSPNSKNCVDLFGCFLWRADETTKTEIRNKNQNKKLISTALSTRRTRCDTSTKQLVVVATHAVQQPILFRLDLVSHRHQIVAGVLVGGDRQDFDWGDRSISHYSIAVAAAAAAAQSFPVEVLFAKDVLKLSLKGFWQRVEAALDGVVRLSRPAGETGLHDGRRGLRHGCFF